MQDAGCKMQDAGCGMKDAGFDLFSLPLNLIPADLPHDLYYELPSELPPDLPNASMAFVIPSASNPHS